MTRVRRKMKRVMIARHKDSPTLAPSIGAEHICVCVCTYKRPLPLKRLLAELNRQETGGLFTYSIVVADNDETESGKPTVEEMQRLSPVPIRYCVEPRRNIALARNKVLENAEGEYIALIDDDEFPQPSWLVTLFKACKEYKVDGVLGPVKRHFDEVPPAWFAKSRIYDREVHPTGMVVAWQEARTGNALLNRRIIAEDDAPFRPEYRAGEDQDFFRRKMEEGWVFIWSADATVFESIPPARWKRGFILRKALLQGATAALQPDCDGVNIAKSLVAIPIYAVVLPFTLLLGQRHFMTMLEKACHHAGKLLMLAGINPIREEYVSE